MKDGIAKIQAHKRRFAVRKGKHRRESSFGSTTFTDGESDSEDESEFCGSGEWAAQGVSEAGAMDAEESGSRRSFSSTAVCCGCMCMRRCYAAGVYMCRCCVFLLACRGCFRDQCWLGRVVRKEGSWRRLLIAFSLSLRHHVLGAHEAPVPS